MARPTVVFVRLSHWRHRAYLGRRGAKFPAASGSVAAYSLFAGKNWRWVFERPPYPCPGRVPRGASRCYHRPMDQPQLQEKPC
jgi:hypothetical protein